MSNEWHVVTRDETETQWAAQRQVPGCEHFETGDWHTTADAAQADCDAWNDEG
jgi:hypothetical protein